MPSEEDQMGLGPENGPAAGMGACNGYLIFPQTRDDL